MRQGANGAKGVKPTLTCGYWVPTPCAKRCQPPRGGGRCQQGRDGARRASAVGGVNRHTARPSASRAELNRPPHLSDLDCPTD